jgi:crossover junction endodeoxyribonuclease RusA
VKRLEFWIPLEPIPQGSMKAIMIGGQARVLSDNKRLKVFRETVTRFCRIAVSKTAEAEPYFKKGHAVTATMTFHFVKPKSVDRIEHTVKPDLDKLVRAVFDGLSKFAYEDDAQVVRLAEVTKQYSAIAGAMVKLEAIS